MEAKKQLPDDFQEVCKKMGAPTFEQFCKNPDKYRKITQSVNEVLGGVDKSSQIFKELISKQVYEIRGFRVKTLEEVERIANDHNIPLDKYTAEIEPQGGGKCDVVVRFVSPFEKEFLSKG